MKTFFNWLTEVKSDLPEVKQTGFWTDKFGEGQVDDASVEDLFDHAKEFPKGLLAGIRSLQLLSSYGSFPKSKMESLWEKYRQNQEKKD